MDLDFLQQLQQEEEYRRSQEERKRKKEEQGNNGNNGSFGLLAILGVIFILIIILALIGSISEDETSNTTLSNVTNEIEENIANVTSDSNTSPKNDYEEKDFENELNSGNLDMEGKTVRFSVKEYQPESAFGDNCWSGEHLNFISEEKVNANIGDIIVGTVTEKPYKFLGSWIVHYELISRDVSKKNETNNVENNV